MSAIATIGLPRRDNDEAGFLSGYLSLSKSSHNAQLIKKINFKKQIQHTSVIKISKQYKYIMSTPNHVAIIMDGNRRWARKKFLPDASGHAYGAKNVRSAVEFCINKKISFLTLFAFSTENWHRSDSEVSFLMKLFIKFLRSELNAMIEEGVHLQIIGDRSRFSAALLEQIDLSEKASAGNSKLTLTIAANYGGRWDIVNALNKHIDAHKDQAIPPLTEDHLSQHCISNVPNVDLMIRTGGEYRISNFLLWQAAYAELYFTDKLWPEFTPADFDNALEWYSQRERRFGKN